MLVSHVEEALHEQAAKLAGMDDFGDAAYRSGLRVFLEALATNLGHQTDAVAAEAQAQGVVLRTLVGRLYSQRGWKQQPEYRDVSIIAPVFIVGLPRSGTTALHQMMSVDPQFQGMEHWLVGNPMVRPPREEWDRIPEYRTAVARSVELAPQFRSLHWMAPDELDECIRVHAQSFVSNHFGSQHDVPDYDAWFLKQDQRAPLRRLADNYRLIGAGNPSGRPWLLKNPSHLFNLDALLEVFPDARIVVTHRDPVKVIPSLCQLLYTMRARRDGGRSQREQVGARELHMWGVAVERLQTARARRPNSFHDVYHTDFLRDPFAVVQEIYGRLRLTLDSAVQERMRAWLRDVAPERKGTQRYRIEDFGLTEAGIAERFRAYREAFASGR